MSVQEKPAEATKEVAEAEEKKVPVVEAPKKDPEIAKENKDAPEQHAGTSTAPHDDKNEAKA